MTHHTFLGHTVNSRADSRLVLVTRGSPEACKFKVPLSAADTLLELSSHPGRAVGLLEQYRKGNDQWAVYTLGIVPLEGGVSASFDGTFISSQHDGEECVFDIDCWRLVEDTQLWLLHARESSVRTRREGRGRCFTMNSDRTISPASAPHLVLGCYVPPKGPADLRSLRVSKLSLEELRLFVRLLCECVHLAALEVEDGDIDDAGMRLIADALAVSRPPLKVLNVNRCGRVIY